MTHSVLPLLRQAAACLDRLTCSQLNRFAVIVGIATAIAASH